METFNTQFLTNKIPAAILSAFLASGSVLIPVSAAAPSAPADPQTAVKASASAPSAPQNTSFGFADADTPDAGLVDPKKQAAEGDAVDFIINTVKNDPNEVELIVLGPATNIAKAIQKAPEEMKKVKRIWSMGTAGLGPGNASPVAEFNVYADAAAYKIMLDSGLPITVIGLDMCDGAAQWTDAQIEQLEALNGTGSFVAKSFGKIREFYKANGSETVMNCDSLAMMCALYPGFVKSTVNTHASCLTEEGEAYSQVIFYKEGFTYDVVKNDFAYNTVLVTEVSKDAYFNTYLEAIK